jgi:hypothetical protein
MRHPISVIRTTGTPAEPIFRGADGGGKQMRLFGSLASALVSTVAEVLSVALLPLAAHSAFSARITCIW